MRVFVQEPWAAPVPSDVEAVASCAAWVAQRPGSAQREHSKTLQMARQQNQQLRGLKKKKRKSHFFFSHPIFFGVIFNLVLVTTSIQAGRSEQPTSVTRSSL